MIEHCRMCGSFDITQYEPLGYKCNFCHYDTLYNLEGHSYLKEDIFNKIINVRIEYKKDKYRYIVLNGKALKKYKDNELETMRSDYTRILIKRNDFLQGSLSYEDFIEFLIKEYNQFGVNYYSRQQCEIISGMNERKNIVSRLTNNVSDSGEYLTIAVDMVKSSKSLSELEENINDVSKLFEFLTNRFLNSLKSAFNKRLTGDGFIALYLKSNLIDFLHLIQDIEEIEKSMIDYIQINKLNIKNDFIKFGVGIDISKVIIIYGKEDIQVGLSINRTTQLSKIHVRDKYSRGIAITTLRFASYINKWININDKKEEKHNNTDVYYIEKEDIQKICSMSDSLK